MEGWKWIDAAIREEVNLRTGQTSCTIYVRNIGKTAVTVDNIFISRTDGTGTTHIYQRNRADFTATPGSVIQGDLMTINIAGLGFTPIATTYDIKVFTTRGIGDEYQAVT